MTRQDVVTRLEIERTKDLLGCDDVTCLTEIGRALGAGFLIRASIGEIGGVPVVSAMLSDATTAQQLGSVVVEHKGGDCLSEAVRVAASGLFH